MWLFGGLFLFNNLGRLFVSRFWKTIRSISALLLPSSNAGDSKWLVFEPLPPQTRRSKWPGLPGAVNGILSVSCADPLNAFNRASEVTLKESTGGTGKNLGFHAATASPATILRRTTGCICQVRRLVAHSARGATSARRVGSSAYAVSSPSASPRVGPQST